MTYYFMTPMEPNFDLMKFDFDKDTPRVYQTGAINDAIFTDLSSFKANGGKLIVVTGYPIPYSPQWISAIGSKKCQFVPIRKSQPISAAMRISLKALSVNNLDRASG